MKSETTSKLSYSAIISDYSGHNYPVGIPKLLNKIAIPMFGRRSALKRALLSGSYRYKQASTREYLQSTA